MIRYNINPIKPSTYQANKREKLIFGILHNIYYIRQKRKFKKFKKSSIITLEFYSCKYIDIEYRYIISIYPMNIIKRSLR